MKNEGKIIYAIFKNGLHQGNQYGFSKEDAITGYLKRCQLDFFPKDIEFESQYDAIIAKRNIHFQSSEGVIVPLVNEE
jgi:hypothetical protein